MEIGKATTCQEKAIELMTTETPEEAVDAPYCRVCRRSSELKWRKHVFSKSHQRAAAELLIARVAKVADARAQVADAAAGDEQLHSATYCVFCETTTQLKRQWVEHYASPAHRSQVHAFCKHHRCDANQQIRPQLCLTESDAQQLMKLLDDTRAARARPPQPEGATGELEPAVGAARLPRRTAEMHAQAFLESAVTRLRQVSALRAESSSAEETEPETTTTSFTEEKASWMGPHRTIFSRVRTVTSADAILQNPLGRHEGKRVWGGGIVKVRKSEWIPWGIDLLMAAEDRGLGETAPDNAEPTGSFQHRQTDAAYGAGLASIKRLEWGETVANIHTAAVPPWMVDTEEEYKQCNLRTSGLPESGPAKPVESNQTHDRSQVESSSTTGGIDIFSKLEPRYDEKTWLPNFGGVWQEGSRLKTRKEFRKVQMKQPARRRDEEGSQAEFKPLRSTQAPEPMGSIEANDILPTNLPDVQTAPTSAPPGNNGPTEIQSVVATDLNAKKLSLLAQKERLRAKLAAKRQNAS